MNISVCITLWENSTIFGTYAMPCPAEIGVYAICPARPWLLLVMHSTFLHLGYAPFSLFIDVVLDMMHIAIYISSVSLLTRCMNYPAVVHFGYKKKPVASKALVA